MRVGEGRVKQFCFSNEFECNARKRRNYPRCPLRAFLRSLHCLSRILASLLTSSRIRIKILTRTTQIIQHLKAFVQVVRQRPFATESTGGSRTHLDELPRFARPSPPNPSKTSLTANFPLLLRFSLAIVEAPFVEAIDGVPRLVVPLACPAESCKSANEVELIVFFP